MFQKRYAEPVKKGGCPVAALQTSQISGLGKNGPRQSQKSNTFTSKRREISNHVQDGKSNKVIYMEMNNVKPISTNLVQSGITKEPSFKSKQSERQNNVFTRLYLNLYSQKSRHNRMVINSIREARHRELWEARMLQLQAQESMLIARQGGGKSDNHTLKDESRQSLKQSQTQTNQSSEESSKLSRSDPLFRALDFTSNIKGFSVSSGSANSDKEGSSKFSSSQRYGTQIQDRPNSKVNTCCFSQMCKELGQDLDQSYNQSGKFMKQLQSSSSLGLSRTFLEDSLPTRCRESWANLVTILNNKTGEITNYPCVSDKDLQLPAELSNLLPHRPNVADMDIETEDETVVVAQRNGYVALLEGVFAMQMGGVTAPAGFYC